MPAPKQQMLSFIEKVAEVQGRRYALHVEEEGVPYLSLRCDQMGLASNRGGPDEDAACALLLNLRFFCQDREATSLCNMAKSVSSLPDTRAQLKEYKNKFLEQRSLWNESLDGVPAARYAQTAKGLLTRRRIFEVFMYGQYAHAKPHEARLYHEWKSGPIFDVLRWEFDLILIDYLAVLGRLKCLCEQIVKHLK
jgi:hypothetical protein